MTYCFASEHRRSEASFPVLLFFFYNCVLDFSVGKGKITRQHERTCQFDLFCTCRPWRRKKKTMYLIWSFFLRCNFRVINVTVPYCQHCKLCMQSASKHSSGLKVQNLSIVFSASCFISTSLSVKLNEVQCLWDVSRQKDHSNEGYFWLRSRSSLCLICDRDPWCHVTLT